jgi:hypothetical protein
VLRVQHAIRVIASTSLGYLKVIARSLKPRIYHTEIATKPTQI